jgi:hypothetical protein
LEATAIATVPGLRDLAADWTGGLRFTVYPQPESIHTLLNPVQNQNVRVREKGLRMAQGVCHRSPKLKHFQPKVFYAELTSTLRRAQIRIPKSMAKQPEDPYCIEDAPAAPHRVVDGCTRRPIVAEVYEGSYSDFLA